MNLLALISGGKDSIYSILCAKRLGHDVVRLGHMTPMDSTTNELDSYMFQTIGHNLIETISECLDIPLIDRPIRGYSKSIDSLYYFPDSKDEVEDLYLLVKEAIEMNSKIEGILTGTVCSRYQLERIKNICSRLGLKTVTPLWNRNQAELLMDMINDEMGAILVKTCCLGLNETHLGKTIKELYDEFLKIEKEFGFNVCGEGGEYETLVLDCPLYKKKIIMKEYQTVYHTKDPYAPTILYVPTKWIVVPKNKEQK